MLLPRRSYTSLQVDHESTGRAIFRLIMGYDRPDRGIVRINDIEVSSLPQSRIPFLRRSIGMLDANPDFAINRTVQENLAMPLHIAGFSQKAIRERIAEKLKLASLDDVAQQSVQLLERTRQRVLACARATVHNPQTIIATCPDTDTSTEAHELIFNMLETANAAGSTVLAVATHTPPARTFSQSWRSYKGSLIRDEIPATEQIQSYA